jgi:hypothetical protein
MTHCSIVQNAMYQSLIFFKLIKLKKKFTMLFMLGNILEKGIPKISAPRALPWGTLILEMLPYINLT